MTSVCRIPLMGKDVPTLDFVVIDGHMVVQVEAETILDSDELCQYPRCRRRVAMGLQGQFLIYCTEHSNYSKIMQKKNYAAAFLKNETGLCVRHGCNNPRALKKNANQLGRCCSEHAFQNNERAKAAYKNNKV